MIAHADINMPPKERKQRKPLNSVNEQPDSGVSGQTQTINSSPLTDQNLLPNIPPQERKNKKHRGRARNRHADSGVKPSLGASQLSRVEDNMSDNIQKQLFKKLWTEKVVAELEGNISTLQELKTTLINQP